ncbi:SCP2 sterol-binding domain-containing protein [Micromonospora sp. A3M-1-15]|uniref:SCP2 sterol-binding domain-containing protein n=1 Tax=Micromonospora sp. A3M-1-15 TaxID=2962035 RepID=UPI0020B6BC05|nr:SCP2 sterol-binding domain-containing protein [Micromonospora sp. A3M-1-15]MCP3785708.1 SCP2 sterol-binding domain-containing protein [Micromonospora sp. A3M-1-15]
MSNPSANFFDGLSRRGHEPLLEEATGTIRFDLRHERGIDRWLLIIDRGDVRVSADGGGGADCVVHSSRELFDRIVTGGSHIYTAWVRNELTVEGDIRLARLIQRLMPGPPAAHHPRDFARQRRGTA